MIAMMSKTLEQQESLFGLTFRVIEAVKRIRTHKIPRTTELPWGFSLTAGIIIVFLTLASSPPPVAQPVNRALSLDEDSDSVRLVSDLTRPLDNLTLEAWLSPAAAEGGFIRFEIQGEPYGTFLPARSASQMWHHVAMTYDGNVARGYLDGAKIGEFPATEMHVPLLIGASSDVKGISFRGLMDEIRIWNVARTQEQIRANMNTTLTGQEPGLVGYWNFDDGTLRDLSPGGNEGVLYGNAQIVEAPPPEIPVTEPSAPPGEPPVDYIWIDLGERNEGLLMTQREMGDGVTEHDVKAGVDCRKVPSPYSGLANNHIYFAIDDSFLCGGENKVWIAMEYFDAGEWIHCHYDSTDGAFKQQGLKLKNTETWKIHVWHIGDGRFENRANGSDFRFSTHGAGDMWLNRIWILTFEPPMQFDPGDPGKRKVVYTVEQEEFYSDYYIQDDAYWDEGNSYFVLTEPEKGQAGRVFFTTPFEMSDWMAQFEIRIWGGVGIVGGADGMAFAFVRGYTYGRRGAAGLDFGGEGYGVEFDTYPNANVGDPRENHIGLLKDDASEHLTSVVIPGGFTHNIWHHVFVVLTNGRVTVYYDGEEVISDYSLPDYTAFTGHFGFTAGTGGDYEYHAVRNIRFARTLEWDHDVMVSSITAPGELVEPAEPVVPSARIFNPGANDEVNIPITCTISAAGETAYSNTQTIESIASLRFQDVTFAEWVPQGGGKYNIQVSVSLIGDGNKDNDISTSAIATILFTDVTEASGLAGEIGGKCVAAGDYDGDGDVDMYTGRLYRNEGNRVFADVTDTAGLANIKNITHSAFGDMDGDQDPDILIVGGQEAAMYRNNSDGTFSQITSTTGVKLEGHGRSVCLADYDGDGAVDIHIASVGANRLYHNNGDGTFQDVTESAGVGGDCWSEAAAFGDYNSDGKLDLYVANWSDANVLYRNNGDGTFADVTETAGVGHDGSARGITWLDYNSDGALDIFVANSNRQSNVLYRNNGDGTFTDVTQESGMSESGWGEAVVIFDHDSDGAPDIYVVNSDGGNRLYESKGDGYFSDISSLAGVGCAGECVDAVSFDCDGDGDSDIYVVRKGDVSILYKNNRIW
jgi:hypothetical protein